MVRSDKPASKGRAISGASVEGRRACWACGHESSAERFCPGCGVIQPLTEGIDYFTCLGFPRRLGLDSQLLTERFHAQSREVHPDFFQTKSGREQALSLEHSAALNRAYRTLRAPMERMAYLIRLESGESEIAAKAPPDLLEEVFELQELLEAYREAGPMDREPAQQARRVRLSEEQRQLEARLAQLDDRLKQLAVEWDAWLDRVGAGSIDDAQEKARKALVSTMREELSRRKYLSNTIEDIRLTLEGREDAKDRRH